MEFRFFGAAGEVTGSMHLLDTGNNQILFDCGMFQGRRKESAEKAALSFQELNREVPAASELPLASWTPN